MTDRPIIFSAPMVRALLADRKTMTRRRAWRRGGKPATWQHIAVGDRLWVRETWSQEHPLAIPENQFSAPGRAGIPGPPGVSYRVIYRADGEPHQIWRQVNYPYFSLDGPADEIAAKHPTVCSNFHRADGKGIAWASSIHMPRWASRLTLTVTDIKIERLNDISEADIRSEGTMIVDGGLTPHEAFMQLWDSIHGNGAWLANPEVVALRFIVTCRNVDSADAWSRCD